MVHPNDDFLSAPKLDYDGFRAALRENWGWFSATLETNIFAGRVRTRRVVRAMPAPYPPSSSPASAAIAGVPYRPSVHVKRPSFSFSPRQSSSLRIATPRRMIRTGATDSSARGSRSAITDT